MSHPPSPPEPPGFSDPLSGTPRGPDPTAPPSPRSAEEPVGPPATLAEPSAEPLAVDTLSPDDPPRPGPVTDDAVVTVPAERLSKHSGLRWVLAIVVVVIIGAGFGLFRVLESNPVPGLTGHSLTAKDFYDSDWQIQLGEVRSHAEKVGAWDHDDCTDAGTAESTAILTENGCEYGIEGIYRRPDLELTIYQRVFVFADQSAAGDAEEALSTNLHDQIGFHEALPDDAAYGTAVGASDTFLVVTIAAETAAPVPEAESAFQYFHTDHVNALLFQ